MLFILHDTLHYWNTLETPVGNLGCPESQGSPFSYDFGDSVSPKYIMILAIASCSQSKQFRSGQGNGDLAS